MIDLFTFGAYGGVYLGPATYGQLSNFNLDCVTVGIHKLGDGTFNRNWQIAQGSIIANTGPKVEDIHPFIIEGQGHTAIANVEAFSGGNPALTTLGKSQDFLLVRGEKKLTVSLTGCRMRNYVANAPITRLNEARTTALTRAAATRSVLKNLMPASCQSGTVLNNHGPAVGVDAGQSKFAPFSSPASFSWVACSRPSRVSLFTRRIISLRHREHTNSAFVDLRQFV